MRNKKLMIIDGNSIVNRAFYGLSGRYVLTTKDGLHTNAIYGFLNILQKYINEDNPEYLVITFDLKAPTFRHKEYKEYKAKRKGMPDELAMQMPILKEVLDAMNIKRLELKGYEADDIIGTIAKSGEQNKLDIIIITGDKDSFQLINERISIKYPSTSGGKTSTKVFDLEHFKEVYGINPNQFIDVKGLMGDNSDNIPGIPGIGEKTALSLIKEYKSIDGVYKGIENIKKPKLNMNLRKYKDLAYLSKRLSTIETKIPDFHDYDMDTLTVKEIDKKRLLDIFIKLEFNSFIKKYNLLNDNDTKDDIGKEKKKKNDDFNDITFKILKKEDVKEIEDIINKAKKAKEISLGYYIEKINEFSSRLICLTIFVSYHDIYYIESETSLDESILLKVLKPFLEDKEIKKNLYGAKDLITYLRRNNIIFEGLGFDIMLGEYIINATNTAISLAKIVNDYLDVEIQNEEDILGKGVKAKKFWEIEKNEKSSYFSKQVFAISEISKIMKKIIIKNKQEELYYDIELPLVYVLSDMEFLGFKIDVNTLINFSKKIRKRIIELTNIIYELANEEFNINSPQQLSIVLFEKLRLPAYKKIKTGYSTNFDVLEGLINKHDIISNIIEYRQVVKLESTYVKGLLKLINPNTGRVHTYFNQTTAITGRLSSKEPNLQNIPIKLDLGREIRRVFIAQNKNYILADADYSQIELRVLAHIAKDTNMLQAFLNNEDIHTNTAMKVFNMPKELITKELRIKAKAVNFGIVYGIGEFSLSKDIGVSIKEAGKYIKEYLDKYPNVKKYMEDVVREGEENGFVKTIFNRIRYMPELKSSNFNTKNFGKRIAMNTPIQGSAADIIKIAMIKVYNELKKRKLKSRLILQVHDELIVETYIEEKEIVKKLLKESMENAVKLDVPLLVEVTTGANWYETK